MYIHKQVYRCYYLFCWEKVRIYSIKDKKQVNLYISYLVYSSFVRVNDTTSIRRDNDFTLPYYPHTTTTFYCYVDTIGFNTDPLWMEGGHSVGVIRIRDHHTGDGIAEYTYVADDKTSDTVIECRCNCPQCYPCNFPITVTIKGMYNYIMIVILYISVFVYNNWVMDYLQHHVNTNC